MGLQNILGNVRIIDALKYRFHRGKRSNLSFYRDSNGNEVDLLVGLGSSSPSKSKRG
jgi:uncharacterized protein